jgi:transposase
MVNKTKGGQAVGGNVVGADPHRKTVSVTVLDERGGLLGTKHFKVSGVGHRQMLDWATTVGPVTRWGIENATGIGRHTTMFLICHGHDVRDVCPTRTAEQARRRRQGKSDALDSLRIARETLADPLVPVAFKRSGDDRGPDPLHEQVMLWHRARRSLVKSRRHLLNEADHLLMELPLELREQLPATRDVRRLLRAVRELDVEHQVDAVTALRLRLLAAQAEQIGELDRAERQVARQLVTLVTASGSTLGELRGLAARSVAELLVEVGDPRRFTEGGFARFNGAAPLPCSSGEGDAEPARHRFNPGGNRRVNAVLHRMAVTQLRCEPRARAIYDHARQRGHTKTEAMRILKRRLSDVVHRRMIHDLNPGSPITIGPLEHIEAPATRSETALRGRPVATARPRRESSRHSRATQNPVRNRPPGSPHSRAKDPPGINGAGKSDRAEPSPTAPVEG